MTKRKKYEMTPTLKANKPKEDDENSVHLTEETEVTIADVRDIDTAHGNKIVADVETKKGLKFSVFVNASSQNNLIDAFGDDDEKWIKQKCVLKIEQAPKPFQNQNMIVFYKK